MWSGCVDGVGRISSLDGRGWVEGGTLVWMVGREWSGRRVLRRSGGDGGGG